tara:strand:+ start:360 stop:1814 length:1455 start_codon:yes stop_codon:yes gene_type:complete
MANNRLNDILGRNDGVDVTPARTKAVTRDFFIKQDSIEIQRILKEDLRKYVDTADISRMRMITLDFFIPAFLDKICNVYDVAPVYKYAEGTSEKDISLFTDLMQEVRIGQVMPDNFLKCRLHNTILTHVKFHEGLDRLYIDNNFHQGNSVVYNYGGFVTEPKLIYWEENPNTQAKRWIVWDHELGQHYYFKKEPKFNENTGDLEGNRYPIGENEDLEGPGYWPFVVYRYRDQNEFWGNGMDSIIEMVRSINILLTIANDDTIQETIRLLILNFNPTGTEGDRGQMKTGLRHPLFVESAFGDQGPDAKILSADLYNKDVVELIEKLTDFISKLHNIDNILKADINQNLSGISLRLKSEPLLRQWAKDISLLRSNDRDLISKIIEVNNYHRDASQQISEGFIENLTIDYQEPSIVTDEKEDYELEKVRWEDGTSSPVRYVMKKNPEFTEEMAKEYIQKNIEDGNEVFGLGDSSEELPEEIEEGELE